MKKALAVLCMVCIAWSAFGQSIDPSRIDVSKAKMYLAGPDQIYVANVYYSGVRMSVLLKYDGADGAIVYGPWFDEDKLLQDYYELGYAKLSIEGNDTLRITDLILGDQGFSGKLRFDGVSKLRLSAAWMSDAPMTKDQQITKLQNDLRVEKKRGEERMVMAKQISDLKMAALEDQLEEAESMAMKAASAGAPAAAMVMPNKIVQSGFTGGRSLSGNWSITSSGATQTDTGSYFAKYMVPLAQSSRYTLYSFDAMAKGSGYVGYGLHFFASGDMYGKGYGLGSSYLVWLTRDPNYYGTDSTYLQLYQSFNDVNMVQLVSVAIPDSITGNNTVEVLYDRIAGLVTVVVNDAVYPSFPVPTRLSRGDKIAIRALGGPVTFSDLTVKTK